MCNLGVLYSECKRPDMAEGPFYTCRCVTFVVAWELDGIPLKAVDELYAYGYVNWKILQWFQVASTLG